METNEQAEARAIWQVEAENKARREACRHEARAIWQVEAENKARWEACRHNAYKGQLQGRDLINALKCGWAAYEAGRQQIAARRALVRTINSE